MMRPLANTIIVVLLFVVPSLAKNANCTSPDHKQFDFWVGDWEVFEADGTTKAADVRVEKILGGCVLHEIYGDTTGLHGESFSAYDTQRKIWHQTWVTNLGQLLLIDGAAKDGALEFDGALDRANPASRVHAIWKPIADGVRETAVTSTDDGRTWKQWFDLIFRPRRASGHTATDDPASAEEIVSALDKRYQAAVKANDAKTMAETLADDFVLITSKGAILGKQDLLKEAVAGTIVYAQQDELEQKVRVWGDTAVVTAKLWLKGFENGKPFDRKLWFSDIYIHTPGGWKYVLGQVGTSL
jgi:ketosteroid isomerase-like protein